MKNVIRSKTDTDRTKLQKLNICDLLEIQKNGERFNAEIFSYFFVAEKTIEHDFALCPNTDFISHFTLQTKTSIFKNVKQFLLIVYNTNTIHIQTEETEKLFIEKYFNNKTIQYMAYINNREMKIKLLKQ